MGFFALYMLIMYGRVTMIEPGISSSYSRAQRRREWNQKKKPSQRRFDLFSVYRITYASTLSFYFFLLFKVDYCHTGRCTNCGRVNSEPSHSIFLVSLSFTSKIGEARG